MDNSKYLIKKITHLRPCRDGKLWLSGYVDEQQAWDECSHGDWMLWLLGRLEWSEPWSKERKRIVLCAMECALTVKRNWPKKARKIVQGACDAILRWASGNGTVEDGKRAAQILVDACRLCMFDNAAINAISFAADTAFEINEKCDGSIIYILGDTVAEVAIEACESQYNGKLPEVDRVLAACAAIVKKHYPSPPLL